MKGREKAMKFKKVTSALLATAMVCGLLTDGMGQVNAASQNLAQGKTATASSYEAGTSYTADKVVDGDTTTRWGTGQNAAAGEYVEIDLGSVQDVKKIVIRFERTDDAQNILGYHVDLDGTTVYTKTEKAKQVETITLTEVKQAQKVKLVIDNADGGPLGWVNVGVNEIEVYGNDEVELTLDDVVASLEAGTFTADGSKFILPEVPDGFDIEFIGADYEQVIGRDLTVYQPIVDTTVSVNYRVIQGNQSKETAAYEVVVPGQFDAEAGDNAKPVVIPELAEWKGHTGDFAITDATKLVVNSAHKDALGYAAESFAADYEALTGKKLSVTYGTSPAAGDFYFTLGSDDAGLGEEGYIMTIGDYVTVEAVDKTGVLWAVQSIIQILKQTDTTMPKGITRDYPRFEVRGFLLDVGRKTFSMDYLYDTLKTMSYYKMNDLGIHLNDNYIWVEEYNNKDTDQWGAYSAFRLESDVKEGGNGGKNKADLTAKDFYYTKDEFRTFIQDAREMGIDVVPEFDAPAHSLAFTNVRPDLAMPEDSVNRWADHLYLENPESEQFIKDVWNEYITGSNPVFDKDTILNVGTDEYEGNNNAFRQFTANMIEFVQGTDRTVRLWGSLSAKPGSVEVPSEDVQVYIWNTGWANPQATYDAGFDIINIQDGYVYMVPSGTGGRGGYGDYLNLQSLYNNWAPNKIGNATIPAGSEQMLGGAYAIWNDNIDLKANGLSESDIFIRFEEAAPCIASKGWGDAKDQTYAEFTESVAEIGSVPNCNPYDKVDKTGDAYESYEFTDLTDSSENDRDLTAGTAKVEGGALVLEGGNSYVTTPIDKIGFGTELSFDITLTEIAKPGDILFETDAAYGTHDIRVMKDGRLGFTRELYDYYFDYVLPVDKTVNIKIVTQQQDTFLYVDGILIGEAMGEYVHQDVVRNTGITHSTFELPLERIGSETNAIAAKIDNVMVAQATDGEEEDVDLYNKSAWTGTTDTETIYNATEGKLIYAFDNNPRSIWHSDWQTGQDKLTGSNTFYAEIDFGQAYTIDEFSFTPRQDGNLSGVITKADLYVKDADDTEWTLVAENKEFAADASEKAFTFAEQEVKAVKLVAKTSNDGWVAVSEFDIKNNPEFIWNVYVEANGNGTVTGGTDVVEGTEVTVTATPAENCTFAGWFNALGEKVSEDAEYTFTVEANTALVAKFEGDAEVECEHKNTHVVGKVEATEEAAGYTGDVVCKDCEEVLEKGTVIDKLPPTPEKVDKTEAQKYFDACEEYYEEADYTEASWAAYAEAMATLEAALAAEDVTAEELQAAVDAVSEAAKNLVKEEVPVDPEQSEDPDKEDDKSPVTGDAASVMVWFMLMAMASVVLVLKKRNAR